MKTRAIAIVVLIAVGLFFCGKHIILQIHIKFARGQVTIFKQMTDETLLDSSPSGIGRRLNYVNSYYPSGSKQPTGSDLDIIVECARSNAVTVIIQRLRDVTEEDLGDDPAEWIEKYHSQKR